MERNLVCAVKVACCVVACSTEGKPPPIEGQDGPFVPGDSAPRLDAGAKPQAPSDEGQDAGDPALAGDGGSMGDAGGTDAGPARCGDGRVNLEDEECDGNVSLPVACVELGFAGGEVSCTPECTLDTALCLQDEMCADGRDNDGDAAFDCDDPDCVDACADPCAEVVDVPPARMNSVLLTGSTLGHAGSIAPSCASEAAGPEVVYRYTASGRGTVEVELESGSLLVASLRSACATDASDQEFACELVGRVASTSVRSGDELYIVVDGRSESDQGPFTLRVHERAAVCGNGLRDEAEECDDGNNNDADGCTLDCRLNPTESEPNESVDVADAYQNPFYGTISSRTDVDVVAFGVTDAGSLRVRVIDLGDGACTTSQMDPLLRLFDADGAPVLEDDDGGEGYCSELQVADFEAGDYFLEVSHAGLGPDDFPYRLVVNTTPTP